MRQYQHFIAMTLFLTVTLGALSYVALSLNEFTDKLTYSSQPTLRPMPRNKTYVAKK